jgi:hypothetical protein
MPLVLRVLGTPVIVAVPVVHEEMHEGARKQQQIRQGSEKVGLMLFPQEEHRNGAEQAGAEPNGEPELLG